MELCQVFQIFNNIILFIYQVTVTDISIACPSMLKRIFKFDASKLEHIHTHLHAHIHTCTYLYTNKASITVVVLNRRNHLQDHTQNTHKSHNGDYRTFDWPKKFLRSRFSVLVLGGINNGLPFGSLYG